MRSHRMLKICAFSFIFYAGGVSLNSKEKGARKYLWPYYQMAHILENVAIARAPLEMNKITIKFSNLSSVASSPSVSREGQFLGLEGGADNKEMKLPEIVKPGHIFLYKPSHEVDPYKIRSERMQKIIDDMICVMRKTNGISLSAPQIGIPLRIIILQDKKQYTSFAPEEVINAQERRSFDPLVILNPKLEKKSNRTGLFFETCLSVVGYGAVVERCLDVEVTGLDHNGKPIIITVSGWQAMVLQHECDHLDGTLYVDKMVPRTFITLKPRGRR